MLCHFFFTSCISSPSSGGRKGDGGISNTKASVSTGYGRILKDNPIILSNDYSLPAGTNLNQYLTSDQDFITFNQFLEDGCDQTNLVVTDCMEVRKDDDAISPLQATDSKWAYQTDTSEWLQVQTFGHMMLVADKFHSSLQTAYNNSNSFQILHAADYKTAFPSNFLAASYLGPYGHWDFSRPLVAYADCDRPDQAFFAPATFSMCFGYDSQEPSVFFAQDNGVVYHEMGHAFASVMMNGRNRIASVTPAADFGYVFYDEAGSIGEGLADWWSYFMNGRTHFAEWGLGRFLNQSRPMDEDDPLHAPGIAADSDSRLSYPTYLLYDPNFPDSPVEDVHYAGQIWSHFMTAVTKDLASQCSWTESSASEVVMHMIYQTFLELGDLTAKGSDVESNYVNLNQTHALEWNRVANPINFRKMTQVFSKYLLLSYGLPTRIGCNNSHYDMDTYEQLVDSYGLLLFDNYNEDGGSDATGQSNTGTQITASNRVKTVMVSKDLIKIDPTQGASEAFIFDNRATMVGALNSLQAAGKIGQLSDQIESDLPFNNGNISISPGEFVGVALNLYNDSNTPMAGIQVLGNDWDHGGSDGKPCGTFEDAFPTSNEGASDQNGAVAGQCNHITRSNGDDHPLFPAEVDIEPVCLVQISDTNATKWAFQNELKDKISLDSSNCLDGDGGNDKECFIRFVEGGETSTYSMLNPKSDWSSTVAPNGSPIFQFNNLLFMEVSPWVPPGTTFNCRMRVRFTNCSDCWVDPSGTNTTKDDYQDYQYSGGDPFKIINFEFIVID